MAWLQYFKGEPTEYILAYSNGSVFRQGAGKAFWYLKHNTSIVLVPASTTDALFVLNEATGNFQAVTLQGQITYRIAQPQTIAGLLNFTIDPKTRQYLSDDPEKLNQRIVNIVQTLTRKELAGLSLEAALGSAEAMGRAVLAQMQQEPALAAMGVECLSLFYTSIKATPEMTKALEAEYREALQKRADQAIYARRADAVLAQMQQEPALAAMGVECLSLFYTSIKATPEMTKALEAEYREALQKRADQAIYARRADAVEQERKIKQNELSTSIDLEKRRQELVDLQGENARKQAEFEAEATRIKFGPYLNLDARLLTALAFRDFASNSQKIGNLTITSEILEQLLNGPASNGK